MKYKYLGIDYGTKRVGLAVSNGFFAKPISFFLHNHENKSELLNYLKNFIKEHEIKTIVFGYPLKMNGEKGQNCFFIDEIIEKLNKEVEVVKINENLTSKISNQILINANISRSKRKEKIDSMAAQMILNDYLNKIKK